MHYKIHYSCLSHIGNVRSINQDNFICDGRYMDIDDTPIEFPLCGTKTSKDISVFGIFDGMGGEECGEIASYIASKTASTIEIGKEATADLSQFCHKANAEICDYATLHEVSAMGTTAAILVFAEKEVVLCNIGDSKIFRLCDGTLEQISKDHVAVSAFGVKPPLSQNLGIPPNELVIDPYLARGPYNDGDIYLICSDGLTDMVCWYCYHKQYNYLKFEQLWQIYIDTPPNSLDMGRIYSEQTIGVRNSMHSIHDDAALIAHLAKFKANEKLSAMSLTAKQCFDELYDEARDLIAKMYNAYEAEEYENTVQEYIHKLSYNDRLYDSEKQKRIEQFRSKRKFFCREDITESDIEHIICAAIPTDRHGNLTPSKASKLNDQFAGKRFSRQHIGDILSGNAEVTRFDLITLNFFVFSQKLDEYPDSKVRYLKFHKSMNTILEKCFLGKLYIQNPYECFVLMCILSDEPLGTYADVWELSYHS